MNTLIDLTLDAALIATTSAWAHWLATHKEFEPDFTWLQVVTGNALCLFHAGARSRLRSGDWRAHEREIWRSFVLGGTPIIVGEIGQWLQRRAERRRYLAQRQ